MATDLHFQFHDRRSAVKRRGQVTVLLHDDGRLAQAVRIYRRHERHRVRGGVQARYGIFDIAKNELGGVFGKVGIVREHNGNGIADVADIIPGEHMLPVAFETGDARHAEIDRRNIGHLLRRPHTLHARQGERLVDIDRQNPPEGNRRSHDAHVNLPVFAIVGCELAAAGQQRPVLEPL